MKTYPLDTPINEILAGQSEYSVEIEHQIDTSSFQPGSTIVYIVGKIFETEYVEQSVCINSDPTGAAAGYVSDGEGRLRGALRNISGGNGSVWWLLPKDAKNFEDAVANEWDLWDISFEDSFDSKRSCIKANVAYDGAFGDIEIALFNQDGKIVDQPIDMNSGDPLMELSLDDEEEAEEELEENSTIAGYTTGDNPFLACVIRKTSEALEVETWTLPDDCCYMSEIRPHVDSLWEMLKKNPVTLER